MKSCFRVSSSWRMALPLSIAMFCSLLHCRGATGFLLDGSGGRGRPRPLPPSSPIAVQRCCLGFDLTSYLARSADPPSLILCAQRQQRRHQQVAEAASSSGRRRRRHQTLVVIERTENWDKKDGDGAYDEYCGSPGPCAAKEEQGAVDEAPWLSVPSSITSSRRTSYALSTLPSALRAVMPFAAASSSFLDPSLAVAADNNNNVISTGSLDPSGFVPVCPTSDGFYRLLQGTAEALVGRDAFVEYGPLIAGGLLRVRLELCVIESFLNEAVVPFVKQNGVSWILPLHETVETFLAGTIFALAATFILIGSTKIVTIIATYADFLIGFPCRLLGGFSYDRALGKPVTLDVGISPFKTRLVGPPLVEGNASDNSKSWEDGDGKGGQQDDSDWSKLGVGNIVPVVVSGSVKSVGIVLGFFREVLDGLDVFVGRYLVFWASFYILIKFLHFKVFPDFPYKLLAQRKNQTWLSISGGIRVVAASEI